MTRPIRRQHIVPRFLLRGFASKPGNRDPFTWMHTPEWAKEINIANVAVGRHFYGDPGDDSLERTIQGEEDGLADFVAHLRDSSPGPLSDGGHATRLVAHLMARGGFVRHFVDILGQAVVRTMIDAIDQLTPAPATQAAAMAKKAVEDARAKGETPLGDLTAATATVESMLFELFDGIRKARRSAFEEAQTKVYPAMKAMHIDLLRKLLPLPERFESEWTSASWSLIETAQDAAILGDTCAVWLSADLSASQPFYVGEISPSVVCLPISSHRVIVGSLNGPVESNVLVETVSGAVAEVASRFFVSSKDLPQHQSMRARIGTRVATYAAYFHGALKESLREIKDERKSIGS
jgi:hypothetical protein